MKEGARHLFVFVLATIFLSTSYGVVAAGPEKKKFDIRTELRGKTFFIQELGLGKKVEKDYYAYFKRDGILAIKYSRKHWKYEKWKVDKKGTLCVTTIHRKVKKTTMYTSKCGRFVKSNETTYRWYNGDGQHRANFILKGKGDRLPGLGLHEALEAEVVLAKERALASAQKAKKREIRPGRYKRRK